MKTLLSAISTCNHDIRNSLTVILANVQRIQFQAKKSEDEKLIASLAAIEARVDRIVGNLEELYQEVEKYKKT